MGQYSFGVVSAATHKSMQGNKRRDTSPEMKVRRMLREMGFTGYRVDWAKAPGRPDVAFVGRKIAVEVRGCFWHRCPVCNLSTPKKNVEYWEAKFARNIERDERNLAELEAQGWKVLVLWEHQLRKKELPATRRIIYDAVRFPDDPPFDEAFPDIVQAEREAAQAEEAKRVAREARQAAKEARAAARAAKKAAQEAAWATEPKEAVQKGKAKGGASAKVAKSTKSAKEAKTAKTAKKPAKKRRRLSSSE